MADVIQLANGTGTVIIQVSDPAQTALNIGLVLATISLAIIAWRSLVASNRSTQKSNELTQLALNLKKAELESIIGKPEIELVTYKLEPRGSGDSPILHLYPNFRNDGKVSARNIKIYYEVMDRIVDLGEIDRKNIVVCTDITVAVC